MSVLSKQNSEQADEQDVVAMLQRGEAGLIAQAERLGMGWTILRPTLIYGAGIDRSITPIVQRALRLRLFPIPLVGGLRQPVHADDIARAVVACIATGAASARVLEIGGGERLPYHAMFRRVHASLAQPTLALPLPGAALRGLAAVLPRARGPVSRLQQDLIADNGPLRALLDVHPRPFQPDADTWRPMSAARPCSGSLRIPATASQPPYPSSLGLCYHPRPLFPRVRSMPDAPSRSAPAERIGVALCTYNGARYLQAQLDSILDQDLPVNEVMIGDDGSSDQTLQLLQAFVPRAQALGIRVEIVQHARNLGYVRNFADALMRCQADILFLCDQDDVWHPGRVRRYVERFHADQGLLLLHSDAWLVDAQGARLASGCWGYWWSIRPRSSWNARALRSTRSCCATSSPVPPVRCAAGCWPDRCRSRRAGATTNGWRSTHRCVEDWTCWPNRPSTTGSMATTRSVPVAAVSCNACAISICSIHRRASARPGACWPWPICWGSAAWWWRRSASRDFTRSPGVWPGRDCSCIAAWMCRQAGSPMMRRG